MYKVILFDLDGTLTESGEGITKSVQYALERIGKPEGRPGTDSFRLRHIRAVFPQRRPDERRGHHPLDCRHA